MKFIKSLINKPSIDLLDVGVFTGRLLKSFSNFSGRKSGIDIVAYPGIYEHITGEFIQGMIDAETLNWSHKAYDIITLYDVVEHTYSPYVAFQNVRELLKDGALAVLENGNSISSYPLRYGTWRWWYACLFEHHVFWNPSSLEYVAKEFGFEIQKIEKVKHKSWKYNSHAFNIRQYLNFLFWRTTPSIYKRFANKYNRRFSTIPWSPSCYDHLLVVFKKI